MVHTSKLFLARSARHEPCLWPVADEGLLPGAQSGGRSHLERAPNVSYDCIRIAGMIKEGGGWEERLADGGASPHIAHGEAIGQAQPQQPRELRLGVWGSMT